MEHRDSAVVDAPPPPERPAPSDPSLLAEALIKAEKFRDFLEDFDGDGVPSLAIVRDYNVLRTLVADASPRLASTLPPEVSIPQPDAASGAGAITIAELHFFCGQIREFLEHHAKERKKGRGEARPAPRVDDGMSLFGPDGLEHDPKLLAAARIKAQTLLDFVEERVEAGYMNQAAPALFVEDYHRLLGLAREAAYGLEDLLPPKLEIPVESKPDQEEDLPAPTGRSWFFSSRRRGPRSKAATYQELHYYCQQLARLLK